MKSSSLKQYALLRSKTGFKATSSLKRGNYRLTAKKRLGTNHKTSRTTYIGKVIPTITRMDKVFSIHIRTRDGRCLNCGSTENLTCSHFHGRSHNATRFDPENCITLCVWCHEKWEILKNEGQAYYNYMFFWLGEQKFIDLETRATTTVSEVEAIESCIKLLEGIVLNEIQF